MWLSLAASMPQAVAGVVTPLPMSVLRMAPAMPRSSVVTAQYGQQQGGYGGQQQGGYGGQQQGGYDQQQGGYGGQQGGYGQQGGQQQGYGQQQGQQQGYGGQQVLLPQLSDPSPNPSSSPNTSPKPKPPSPNPNPNPGPKPKPRPDPTPTPTHTQGYGDQQQQYAAQQNYGAPARWRLDGYYIGSSNPSPNPNPDPSPNPNPDPSPNSNPDLTRYGVKGMAPQRFPALQPRYGTIPYSLSPGEEQTLSRMVKAPPWQRPSSAPMPPRGAPGGSGQLGTPRKRPAHWAPSHCLGCSSEPPPKPPISPPLTIIG